MNFASRPPPNGDRGGNDVHLTYFGRSTNLHAVWDGGIIEEVLHIQLGPNYAPDLAATRAEAAGLERSITTADATAMGTAWPGHASGRCSRAMGQRVTYAGATSLSAPARRSDARPMGRNLPEQRMADRTGSAFASWGQVSRTTERGVALRFSISAANSRATLPSLRSPANWPARRKRSMLARDREYPFEVNLLPITKVGYHH
jgi:hypothetical protein